MVSKKCQINGLLLILVTESGYRSNLADFKCEMSQDSILGPLLFFIYINDLHLAIKFLKCSTSQMILTQILIVLKILLTKN